MLQNSWNQTKLYFFFKSYKRYTICEIQPNDTESLKSNQIATISLNKMS